MQWHAEYRHQSNVTLSEHFSCLDWQVISEDKLHFDLVFTHLNKNTGEEQHLKKRKKETPVTFQILLLQSWLPITALHSVWSNGAMSRLDVNVVY